uniref:Uncharacterized protein n=1 Tax=Anguilla anguilla TaxID=7936 RepID=A0A0E9UDU4_ANGAN
MYIVLSFSITRLEYEPMIRWVFPLIRLIASPQ